MEVKHLGKKIDVYIDPDDHVSLVFKKIAFKLNVNPSNIYVWIKQAIHDGVFLMFIKNVFKGESLLDFEVFREACLNYFGVAPGGSKKMISKETALAMLEKLKTSHVTQPIGHYFLDAEYFEYLPYAPGAGANANLGSLYNHSLMNMTLQTAIGNGDAHVLHVVTTDDVKDNRELYFPFQKNAVDAAPLKKFLGYIMENEQDFVNAPTKVSSQQFLNILYLKSNEVYASPTTVDLSVLFNAIQATENIPFIKYKAHTNIFHKVYKKFLAASGDIKDFEKWYEVNNFKMQTHTFIVFKLKYKTNKYFSFILNDMLQYDIRLNFQVKDEEKLENLGKVFEVVNALIARLKALFSSIQFPALRASGDNYDIHRFVSFNIASLETKASKSNAESFVRTKMFQYFDVLPSDVPNVLRLQYKKVDNFGKSENINMYIQQHFREGKEVVLKKLVDFFALTDDEAENEYEKWELKRESEGMDVTEQIKYERYVEVKLRFNSPIDVRYVVTGATSLQMNARLVNLVGHILQAAATKTRETKKDIEAKKIMEDILVEEKVPVAGDLGDLGGLGGDDDDWAAELKALEDEFAGVKNDDAAVTTKALEAPLEDADGKVKLKGFVKRMLDTADRDLFNYKSESNKRHDYASMCGWVDRRQPVVINEHEKKVIDEKYPGAYEGYVKSGSIAELEKRNYYICPKIWCPKNRVAIPPALYKEKGADACPGSEEPILFESKSFWGLGDKSFERKHIPGFLDKHTRSDGLCLPCCFKIAPTEGNRNKQRKELCVPSSENREITNDEAAVGTEKYIKSDAYYPLEIGRYGLVPKDLSSFLGKMNCGSRHNGTGLMTDKTDCYLRKGIYHGNQSFIHSMIACMDNPKITSYKDFIAVLNKRLTIHHFIALENGKILQLFIDNTKSIFSDDFVEFRKWLLKDNDYVARFNLLKLQKELGNGTTTFSRHTLFYKDIIREFMIYYSYKNFLAFMNNAEFEKDHRILLDLFNITTEWLNINEYNFVVLDVDKDGKVFVDCSLNRDTKQFVNRQTPFVFLLKQARFYEPLYHVKTASNEDVHGVYKFNIKTTDHPRIRDLLTFYYNNCSSKKKDDQNIEIALYLESQGYKAKYYVIDYDFRLCGLILANNIYVPFEGKKDIFALRGLRFVYISDVVMFKCLESEETIKKVYRTLEKKHGDFYAIDHFDGGEGFFLKNGSFIPVNIKSASSHAKSFTDDLYIFTGEQEDDARTKYMKAILEKNAEVRAILSEFESNLDEKTKMEVMFLKDSKNPLPVEYKRDKMAAIMKRALRGRGERQGQGLLEIADILLNKFYDARRVLIKRFAAAPDEIIFDFNDIQEGRLHEIIERAQNPYKLFHKKLNEMFDQYVFEDGEQEGQGDDFAEFINERSVFADVPAKYGTVQYRKILKGFSVLENDKDILYKLFVAASKTSKNTAALNEDVLKSITKTNIVKDFAAKSLDLFEANPAYGNHLKKMKIKTPTLDTVMEVFQSMYYRPSFYEIRVLARAIDINVILIGRQSLKNPNGLFEVIYTRSPYYLFLVQSYDRFKMVDNYQPIVKNKKDVLLSKGDLPTEIIDMVNKFLM
jgi:hypothetical protein